MMKRKVYILNGTHRAANYGIGTYIQQLTDSLKNTSIDFEVVLLYASGDEVVINDSSGYKEISIPWVSSTVERSYQYYTRNVAYLLKELAPDNKNLQYIFHFS